MRQTKEKSSDSCKNASPLMYACTRDRDRDRDRHRPSRDAERERDRPSRDSERERERDRSSKSRNTSSRRSRCTTFKQPDTAGKSLCVRCCISCAGRGRGQGGSGTRSLRMTCRCHRPRQRDDVSKFEWKLCMCFWRLLENGVTGI